jgi:purine-binding chemotaxis protein CheW
MFQKDTSPDSVPGISLPTGFQASPPSKETETLRVIIFTVGDYQLALPLATVLKVMNCPPVISSSFKSLGLIYIGQAAIKLINFHAKLDPGKSKHPETEGRFLIILQPRLGELWGIPIDNPPNLIELPLTTFRVIPKSHCQDSLLGLASHVAIMSQEEMTSTIFLLDLDQVFNEEQQRSESTGRVFGA